MYQALVFATIHEQPLALLYCGITTMATLEMLLIPQ
jgi:hypothetical protein